MHVIRELVTPKCEWMWVNCFLPVCVCLYACTLTMCRLRLNNVYSLYTHNNRKKMNEIVTSTYISVAEQLHHVALNRKIYVKGPFPLVTSTQRFSPAWYNLNTTIQTDHLYILAVCSGHHILCLLCRPHWAVSQRAYLCVIVLSGFRGQFVKGLFLATNFPVVFPRLGSI